MSQNSHLLELEHVSTSVHSSDNAKSEYCSGLAPSPFPFHSLQKHHPQQCNGSIAFIESSSSIPKVHVSTANFLTFYWKIDSNEN
jgi:hypothetical protein